MQEMTSALQAFVRVAWVIREGANIGSGHLRTEIGNAGTAGERPGRGDRRLAEHQARVQVVGGAT